jgi:hypothetical protein
MRRASFIVAHELGHFLLERHVFEQTRFKCTTAGPGIASGTNTHPQQEAEANQFAISLLAPPCRVLPILSGEPDLANALILRDELDISLEASVRLLIDFRPEPLASLWSKDGKLRYCVINQSFPRISLRRGASLQADTAALKIINGDKRQVSVMTSNRCSAWVFRSDISTHEQTWQGWTCSNAPVR